jgi:hypothetical protein
MEWVTRGGRRIHRHVLRTGSDLGWIMLYPGPEAATGLKGGYEWDGRGQYAPTPLSTTRNASEWQPAWGRMPPNNFQVVQWTNITLWPGGPGFYFLNMGGCWKDAGVECDGDITTDVTRYLLTKYPDLARGVVVQVKRHRPEDHDDRTFPFIVRDFPIPGTYYYRRSIEMLLEKSERKDLAYFVFSTEDYEWARTIPWLATLPGPLIFADQEDEVHQFYMMMLARAGVVCANQANCWWGAYLGIEKRPVFLPHHYYNAPGQEPMGILYPGDVHAIHSDNLRGEGPPPCEELAHQYEA